MLCSFSVLWPELSPAVCHLNQTCLNLGEVRSGTGAGMYPDIPWLALHWETQELIVLHRSGRKCPLALSGVVESVCTEKCSASGRGNAGPASLRCCRVAKHPQQIEIM